MGNGTLIKFKAGSGGGGEVTKSELRKLTGTLNCEIHDGQGKMVTLSASGEFDAVKKELVWVEGSATFHRPIEPLGPGILIIENLTGSARLEKGKLVWAEVKGDLSIPPLKDATGSFNLKWRNDGSKDYYSGSGKLKVNLIEDTGTGRKLGGEVGFEYREDDTYKVDGKLDFSLNEKIGGEVTMEMEGGKGQPFDPVIGATINYREELIPEKELFKQKMALLPAQNIQLGYGFMMNFGADAGLGLNLRPLMAEATIGFQNWRPMSEGNTPSFTAGLNLDWGVDFEMFVAAYLSLGWVAAGGGIRGEAKLNIGIPVTAAGELSGGPDGFGATLDFGVAIEPSVTLSATPYLYAGLDGIAAWRKDLETYEYTLGDLFSWEWNKRYEFGDVPGSTEGAAGQTSAAPSAESTDAAQESAPTIDPPSAAPASKEPGAPELESGQEMGEQSGMGSGQGGGEMSEMEEKMAVVEKIGKGIGALAYLLGLVVKLLTALATAGLIGLMLMFVWEICFEGLSWDKLVESVNAVIDLFTDPVVMGYLEDLKPDWWKKLEDFIAGGKPGLADALFGADDKMREAVHNGEHREADTKMRGKMMECMMDGVCGDADEDCILIVLRFSESEGDLPSVVSAGGGAQRMWEKLDGRQNDELEIFDRNGIHYSSGVGAHIASLW